MIEDLQNDYQFLCMLVPFVDLIYQGPFYTIVPYGTSHIMFVLILWLNPCEHRFLCEIYLAI